MSQCAQKFHEGGKQEISVSPAPHPSQKLIRQAICTFKDNSIAVLASTHKYLPIHLWCQLLPHASLALNLLRQSHINPKIYGYAKLHGEFNYNATTIDLPETQVIIHEKPTVIVTWTSGGLKGWYLGPSMNHYRCHSVYNTNTRG